MFDQWQTYWQNITPDMQTIAQEVGVVLAALLGGHLLGKVIGRALQAKNFDAALRMPGSQPEHGMTPTVVAGLLIRLTVWAAAASWVAHRHGRDDLSSTIALAINRTWGLATLLVASLGLGSMLARRVLQCLRGSAKAGMEANREGGWDAAGAVAAGVYLLAVLLALLFAADVFDWPLTRTTALALWEFAQRLLIAMAALFIGCLGARWARDLAKPEGAATPEQRAGQYTAIAMMAGTTCLAVVVLLSGAGLLIALGILAVVGVVLWLVRGYLPDVTAGLQLRMHQVREVFFEGVPWKIAEVGFLTSQVGRAGKFCRTQNRVVLEARMHGSPMEAATRERTANGVA